jgi:hypothetical protein
MMALPGQLTNGFWLGIGFALAFAAWGLVQLVLHRAEGR